MLPNSAGNAPIDASNWVNSVFRPALTRCGITDFRFHDLRHTFASRLAMAGVPPQAIQALLGHESLRMTERYMHLAPGHTRDAV